MDADQILGTLIRDRRIEKNWTQEDLAEQLFQLGDDSIRQSDISRIESGHVLLPRRERLERLATALDIPLVDLLLGSGWLENATNVINEITQSDEPTVHANLVDTQSRPQASLDNPETRHQLRNRLAVLSGYAELLHQSVHEGVRERSAHMTRVRTLSVIMLDTVYSLVDELQRLMENIDRNGKPSSGRSTPNDPPDQPTTADR